MIVKKFQAPTEREAVLEAQKELGNGAVVLNVKKIKQPWFVKFFKKDVVEVTVALEEKEFINGIKDTKPTFDKVVGDKTKIDNIYTSKGTTKENAANTGDPIEEKLDSLHNMLENQLNSATSNKKANNDKEKDNNQESKKEDNINLKFLQLIYNKLIDNDVDEKYANTIIGEIEGSIKKESNLDSLLSIVYQKIILKLGEPKNIDLSEKAKVVFFIGPTGVGKTTTIAKLASKYKIEEKKKVAFITADTYRIAAVEQLNTYASIIDCPVNVVYTTDELSEAVNNYNDFDLILVDTAGRSHKADEQMQEIVDLINNVKLNEDKFEKEIYLTLSVTTKYRDLMRIADAYKEVGEYRILFTKLDETCALGNILNMRMYTNAYLSYTTSGQNVPNDIETINEQALAKILLGGNS